jgi:hypothetical protein
MLGPTINMVTVLLILVIMFFICLEAMRTFDQNLWSTKWGGIKKSIFFHPIVGEHYFLKHWTNFDWSWKGATNAGRTNWNTCVSSIHHIYDSADWIYLAHCRSQWSALVKTLIKNPQRDENFWILWRRLNSKEGPFSLETLKLLGENIFLPYWSDTILTLHSHA